MKKTFIALVALSGLAWADGETTPITLTNPASTAFTWVAGSNGTGITTTMETEGVQGIINVIPAGTSQIGWFGGTGQSYGNNNEVVITGNSSFTFISRPKYTGEYVMMGIALPEKASAITLGFTADKYVGYAVFAYDGENVTEIMPKAVTNADKSSGATVSVTKEAEVAPSTLFVLWSNKPDNETNVGGGTTITVSNITVAYTPAVPEPATATLSLLALAGLASRRRRH